MAFWNEETTWLEIIEAIEVCLEHDVSFDTEQMPNAPPNRVARQCIDMDAPSELTDRQRNIIDTFILPRLHAFECADCSTRLQYVEISSWFDNDQRCTACAHRTQKIRN